MAKEVVECVHGPSCGGEFYSPDHHGWDCPLSDPMGDVLRAIGEPTGNPILDNVRNDMLKRWGVEVKQ